MAATDWMLMRIGSGFCKEEGYFMTEEQEPIKIVIEEEEPTFRPERPNPELKEAAGQLGQVIQQTAKQAWESETRKKVTSEVQKGVTAVSNKGYELVRDKVVKTAEQQAREQVTAMQTRLRETDWKQKAKAGTAQGLKWLSEKLADLAEKIKPSANGEQ